MKNSTVISSCKLSYVIVLLFILCNSQAHAQFQNWYFGRGCGLSFASGSPVNVTPDPPIYQREGSASISDASGHLLFYTNGITVWDNTHTTMPGSISTPLAGAQTSTQSATIIPAPGNQDQYYIFTANATDASSDGVYDGLAYTKVDMTLRGGLGDLVPSVINQVLYKDAGSMHMHITEKVAAVKQCNGKDFWVITHETGGSGSSYSDTFVVYSVTALGVSFHHKQAIGTPILGSCLGYLKFSQDGTKLVNALGSNVHPLGYGNSGGADVFDFDNRSGMLSNWIELPYAGPNNNTYGAEFSPNRRFVYLSELGNTPAVPSSVYQYDLSAGSAHAIYNSAVLLSQHSRDILASDPYYYAGLLLGPDSKIYVCETSTDSLAIISYPDSPGVACRFTQNAHCLDSNASCQLGLPNNYSSNAGNETCRHNGIEALADNVGNGTLKIMPNPCADKFQFELVTARENSNAIIEVMDVAGRIIMKNKIENISVSSKAINVDAHGLSSGIYWVIVSYDGSQMTGKLIKE